MVDFAVVPERTALVNVDLQNWFVDMTPEGVALVERVNELARACREAGMLVVHTSHVLRSDGSNIGVVGEIVPEVKQGALYRGSHTAALHEKLVLDPRDVLLEKPRFGAFHGTDLDLILRGRGIDTIIVSGISTSVCCDTTAGEANARDFRVLFLSDGTATPAGIDAQQSTLAVMGGVFAQVLSVAEVLNKIAAAASTEDKAT
jgi:biuret amidohydrolase